jgi:hypothetical protein
MRRGEPLLLMAIAAPVQLLIMPMPIRADPDAAAIPR